MKIVSYNVNGIRAAIRKGLLTWLAQEDADVVCLQEIKAEKEQVDIKAIEALGYRYHYWFSARKKGYSGVAILSRIPPDEVTYGTGIDYMDEEGRNLRADFGDVSVMSLYLPSGTNTDRLDLKFKYMDDFQSYVKSLRQEKPNLVISGDYNICHRPIDIHDPVRNAKVSGFLPEERAWLESFMNDGFIDSFRYFDERPHQYSWWTYRANARNNNKGWRIDYNLVSEALKDRLHGADIRQEAMHSDHCPVVVTLK